MSEQSKDDRRTRRTRTALINAFNHLVLNRTKKDIRVADVIERADVGRSTFYEHYSSADDLHLQALARPLSILADAVCGRTDEKGLLWLLEHFWENRSRARRTFGGPLGPRISRLLVEQIAERLDGANFLVPARLAAAQLAEGPLAAIKIWISGEASCSAEALAASICKCAHAAREGLAARQS